MKKEKFVKRPNSSNNRCIKRNSKDLIIKNLEKKINEKDKQISELLEYKNLCENKFKEVEPSLKFRFNKEINENEKSNSSYISLKNNKNNVNKIMKYNKTKSDLYINQEPSDKNDKLLIKYLNLLEDYNYLKNNTISTQDYTEIKSKYNQIKNQNSLLLKKINNKENENETIQKLNNQVESLREQLILSQALINSLKTELEYNNKNNNENKINNIKRQNEENEKLKISLKKNNLLLSNILKENNELREKCLYNFPQNNNFDNNSNIKNLSLINTLQNNLKEYENKFDYFNDYINNIKNQISLIFNDLKNIINQYKKNENFLKDIKIEINNLKNIDRYNLDSNDDEKCLQAYMNLVKSLLNNNNSQKENKDVNNIKGDFNKSIKQITELCDIINKNINGDGFKRLISDALNIITNLSNIYINKNENYQNGNNENKEKLLKMENDFEYIKRIMNNYKQKNRNKKLTYTLSYNSQRFSTINRTFNNNFFKNH